MGGRCGTHSAKLSPIDSQSYQTLAIMLFRQSFVFQFHILLIFKGCFISMHLIMELVVFLLCKGRYVCVSAKGKNKLCLITR